jgi:hypothetical protein
VKYRKGGPMTDENQTEEVQPQGVDPHAADPDEVPEEHIGEEIPDPWTDDAQTDWPTGTVGLDGGATVEEV